MQLSTTVASTALVIGVVVCAGYARSQDAGAGATQRTMQSKIDEREAQRRVAMAEHQKRKQEFVRRCTSSQPMTPAQLDSCRAAYRKL